MIVVGTRQRGQEVLGGEREMFMSERSEINAKMTNQVMKTILRILIWYDSKIKKTYKVINRNKINVILEIFPPACGIYRVLAHLYLLL